MQQEKRKLHVMNWDFVLVAILVVIFWVKVGSWIAGFGCWS